MSRSSTLSRPLARPRRRGLLPRLLDLLALLALRRQRRTLRDLPPHILRDIGLTEDEARTEAARPLWDVPPHWRG